MDQIIKITDLVTKIGFPNGEHMHPAQCNNPEQLRTVVSESLYQSISLFSKETPLNNVKIIVHDLLEDFKHDDIRIVLNAIADIRKGKFKIYGMVTPHTIREAMKPYLENTAIELERANDRLKASTTKEPLQIEVVQEAYKKLKS